MSMNFGREQSLLRQKLSIGTTPAAAAARQQELGTELSCLGASDAAVATAAHDLVAAHPQMGRAQMTAFVRTLWRSRIHELRVVGVELLAARHTLLEPADLPFLEDLLRDCSIEPVATRLADGVLGALLLRSKKLWKDLERMATGKDRLLCRAAIRACRQTLLGEPEAFPRFAGLVQRVAAAADAELWATIDAVLLAVANQHGDMVRQIAQQHGRVLVLPTPTVVLKPAVPPTSPPPNSRPARSKTSTASTKAFANKTPAGKPPSAKVRATKSAKAAPAQNAKASKPARATAGRKPAASKRRPTKKA